VAALSLCLALAGCQRQAAVSQDNDVFGVPGTRLHLPKRPGWVRDPNLVPASGAQGGTVLRLVRQGAVPGSPRVEVVVERNTDTPAVLEDFLTRNLRAMGQLEAAGQIHILHVDQQRVALGDVPAYRVHHEYTAGAGSAQVSLFQVSVFVVLDGVGITVTAAGRTELFHPLAGDVSAVLDGLSASGAPTPAALEDGPIDLGRVGGTQP
jgi:hypothetical protein